VACEVAVELPGADCATVTCPAEQPFPVGCVGLAFNGGDGAGCVAHQSGPSVFFKEGDDCSGGVRAVGALLCSQLPGDPLSAANCPHNKQPHYPPNRGGCPD
jgi:hypothetical protein